MSRTLIVIISLITLACTGGCNGDDTGATPDQKVTPDKSVDLPTKEAGGDGGKDGGQDAPGDISATDKAGDVGQAEVGTDAGGEASAGDLTPDKKKPADAASLAVVEGWISRKAIPLNDGKGDIYVSVAQVLPFPFPPIGMANGVVSHADLSKAGAKVKYQITSSLTTLSGAYEVTAWMDDNNNGWSPLAMASTGDLLTSKAVKITISSSSTGPVKADLVLDKVQVPLGDAGVGTALRGKITTTTGPLVDGKGNIIIALYTKLPPAGLVPSVEALSNADLSSTYASEAYFLSGVKPGNYYLRIFMDDNTNASLAVPNPDKGDMVHTKPIQVHVVSGQVNVQDVVLDALKK